MKITMFYDATCQVCRTEAFYMAQKNPDNIRIKAVTDTDAINELAKANLSQLDAMTYLCVKDEDGHMHKGMAAVRLLYEVGNMKYAHWLSKPIIKQASNIIYPIFAKNRYKMPNWVIKLVYGERVGDCETGVCSLPPIQRLSTSKT